MYYIGTAGYSYKDWIGPFYPEGIKTNEMLEYYCKHFNFVEINSSYYHMPALKLFESITSKTPDDFKVVVKLFKGFTHDRNLDKSGAEKFLYSLKPLDESSKLISLLAQFPYSFHYNKQNIEYLKRLREWFFGNEICIEFRNREWICKEVMDFLKSENLGFVCVDEPDINGLIKKVVASTSGISYVRFHGRNKENWYKGEGSERYNYLYNMEELIEWVPSIKSLEKNARITVVSFNNHPIGRAVENAKMLANLLGK